MGSRVEGTPFVIGSVKHLDNDMCTEIRAAIETEKPRRPTMIFFFGKPEPKLQDSRVVVFDMSKSEIPDGIIYAKFRRQALLHLKHEMLKGSARRIVLLTNIDTDILAYLIVRWIVDELGQPVENAIEAFTCAWPSGIRMNRTFQSLHDLYTHNPSTGWYFGNPERYMDPPDELRDLGEKSPSLPPLTEEQLAILEKSIFIVRFPRPEEIPSPKPEEEQPDPPTEIVMDTRRATSFDHLGVPVDIRSCAWFISCLNRKLNIVSTVAPMRPMKPINYSNTSFLMENSAALSVFPLPMGMRCILHVHDGCSFLISEKGIGRQVNCKLEFAGKILPECTIEGYLCNVRNEECKLVLVDILVLGDRDLRSCEYSERLQILSRIGVTVSHFVVKTIQNYRLHEYGSVFHPGCVDYPVDGLYLGSLTSTWDCAVFFWKNITIVDPVVLVVFMPYEKKFMGLVHDRISMRPVLDFGAEVPVADGDLVDLKYSYKEKRWNIIGKSTAERAWTYSMWSKATQAPPLSFDDLKSEMERLIQSHKC